jgi:hypothetical protein
MPPFNRTLAAILHQVPAATESVAFKKLVYDSSFTKRPVRMSFVSCNSYPLLGPGRRYETVTIGRANEHTRVRGAHVGATCKT